MAETVFIIALLNGIFSIEARWNALMKIQLNIPAKATYGRNKIKRLLLIV